MEFWDNFWSIFWFAFFGFAFVVYLMTLFSIIGDLFRDRELSGAWKAVWLIFLIFLPFLTALAYLLARGEGMAKRSIESAQKSQAATESYIREVAGSSTADEIAKAKALVDSGAISAAEFEALKAKVLAS